MSDRTEQIATFHTHLGAIRFHKRLRELGDEAVMMPVPRKLSASCGTCVKFTAPFEKSWIDEDLNAVYAAEGKDYRLIYSDEEE